MIHAKVIVMKISNSKKELARIISEHGGWRNGAEWATQGHVVAFFSGGKPKYETYDKTWCANGDDGVFIVAMSVDGKIRGFHNTILSRAEYFHLYPAPDADGWIEWKGVECPVDVDALVCCKWRSGKVSITAYHAGLLSWRHNGNAADIIAYRLHKPEQVETIEYNDSGVVYTGPVKSEFVVDEKPTIDQLLQDWRNADYFAKRKHAEADEAAAMREERWEAVQASAGEIGVTVGRCDSATKADQKLVITDWRDLKSGDVVMVVCSSNPAWKSIDGDELVVRINGDACDDVYFGTWCMSDNTDWVFIRRQ